MEADGRAVVYLLALCFHRPGFLSGLYRSRGSPAGIAQWKQKYGVVGGSIFEEAIDLLIGGWALEPPENELNFLPPWLKVPLYPPPLRIDIYEPTPRTRQDALGNAVFEDPTETVSRIRHCVEHQIEAYEGKLRRWASLDKQVLRAAEWLALSETGFRWTEISGERSKLTARSMRIALKTAKLHGITLDQYLQALRRLWYSSGSNPTAYVRMTAARLKKTLASEREKSEQPAA